MSEIPHHEACRLLSYDPQTGKLFWRRREPSDFASGRVSSQKRADQWNSTRVGEEAFTSDDGGGYRIGRVSGRKYRAHRLIWFIVYGYWPNVIDHINGQPSDNRIENLRDTNASENQKNAARRQDNTSGFPGVSLNKHTGKWGAYISSDGKRFNLGHYDSIEGAISRRMEAQEQHGYHPNCGR